MKIEKTILNKNSIIDLLIIKHQLIIDNDYTDEDVLLQSYYINASVEFLENKIHADLYQKECTATIKDFTGKDIVIEHTPLSGVTEIQVNNSIYTGYTVNDDSFIDFRIEFDDYIIDSDVVIKFKTGYSELPDNLKLLIMKMVNDEYEFRGLNEYSEKTLLKIRDIITPYIRNYY